jgi:hypothetical protein
MTRLEDFVTAFTPVEGQVGALAVDGKVVHLCAFRLRREVHSDAPAQGHRLARDLVRRLGRAY